MYNEVNVILEYVIKLTTAMVFAGAIGLERSLSRKAAGFRTMILICMGTTLFTDLGLYIVHREALFGQITIDKIIAAIITGIGFLGAGTIMHGSSSENVFVEGLTTAAAIWFVAGIGILIGMGFIYPAAIATVYVLIILMLFSKFEKRTINWFKNTFGKNS